MTATTLKNLLETAKKDWESHAYDQWEFAWSAKKVAEEAARAGEILWGNVSLVTKALVRQFEADEKKAAEEAAKAAAEKAAAGPTPMEELEALKKSREAALAWDNAKGDRITQRLAEWADYNRSPNLGHFETSSETRTESYDDDLTYAHHGDVTWTETVSKWVWNEAGKEAFEVEKAKISKVEDDKGTEISRWEAENGEKWAALAPLREKLEAEAKAARAAAHAAFEEAHQRRMAEENEKRAKWVEHVKSVFSGPEWELEIGWKDIRVRHNGKFAKLVSSWESAESISKLPAEVLASEREAAKREAERIKDDATLVRMGLDPKVWIVGEHKGRWQASRFIKTARKKGYWVVVDERGNFGKIDKGYIRITREEATAEGFVGRH